MGPFLRYLMKVAVRTVLLPLRIFRVDNSKVFLLNDLNGTDSNYSSNPKYIANFLLENHPNKYKMVYALGKQNYETRGNLPDEIIYVKLKSIAYFYHVLTSKFFITTSGGVSYIPFKKNQIVINSWHGGGAYKKMGLDASDDESLRKALIISERKTNYFVSSNNFFSRAVNSAFLIPYEKIINIGLPRNDIFFNDEAMNVASLKVRDFYSIGIDTNIILYAPTYRSEEESIYKKHRLGPYSIDYERVVKAFSDRFGGKWVFAIRLHPSIAKEEIILPDNVINMGDYYDPQELFACASVLINDYSSTMWDFSLTRKPCFIFAPDVEHYNLNLGFYTQPNQWPFPFSKTNDELIKNIDTFTNEKYIQDLEEYYSWMESYETGTACEQLVEKVLMKEVKL